MPSSTSHLERLPLELRLRILSFTHLGSRGDYLDQHSLMYLDIGHMFRTLEPDNHSHKTKRSLDLDLLLVNHQMYIDAFDVLYRESYFGITPSVSKILDTVRKFPRAGLQRIQLLKLRASFVDVDLILKNAWNGKQGKAWADMVDILRRDCDLKRLMIVVDLRVVDKWCQGEDLRGELRREAVWRYYMFVTSVLCGLRGVKGVRFEMIWAKGMGPWMEREVLGERYRGVAELPGAGDTSDDVPIWHQNIKSIKEFDFSKDGAVFS